MKKKILPEHVFTTPDCFRQRVNLPSSQTAGLSRDELAAALGFEIEPFSGIPRADSEMAWKEVGDAAGARRIYDVVQIRRADMEKAVAEGRKMKRVVRAVTAPPESAAGETVETLPWIEVRRSGGLSGVSPYAVWAAACAIAACALAWDFWGIRSETAELRREVSERRVLQREKDGLGKKLSSAKGELDALRAGREAARRAQDGVAAFRAAWKELLSAVSGVCGDEVVVRSIASDGAFSAEISGVALSAEAAGRFFVRMAEALHGKGGWRIAPGKVVSSGGTVSVSCRAEFDVERALKTGKAKGND